MLATCPNCGCDLQALLTFEAGQLKIANGVDVTWRGDEVPLTACQRLIVIALARAAGVAVTRLALAEAAGHEGKDPENFVAVMVNRIHRHFRAIDPDFAAIESVRGAGLRWRTA